jgi:hypothetical protein
LKLEGQKDKVFVQGQRIPAGSLNLPLGTDMEEGFLWTGHARSDGNAHDPDKTLRKQWLDRGWEPATIKGVEVFTERKRTENGMIETPVMLKCKAEIGCLINREEKTMVVLTRKAKTDNERQVHNRFPVYAKDRDQLIIAVRKRFAQEGEDRPWMH